MPRIYLSKEVKQGLDKTKEYLEREGRRYSFSQVILSLLGEKISLKTETRIEKRMRLELERRGIKHRQEVAIDRYVADFVVNDIVIECDGNYWHRKEETKIKDQAKDVMLSLYGYRVMRFSESELKGMRGLKRCVDKIERAMK